MRINTPLEEMSRQQVKKICKIIIDWCFDHLGENKRIKKDLLIEMVYDETDASEGFAEYDIDEENRIIRIFMSANKTIKHLIFSFLHEYTHDLQPVTTKYDKLRRRYGYINHPQEKQARRNEDRFAKVCWNDIRPKVEKLFD